jgi:Nuclear transport factor 2 (NTF2) domain
MMTFEGQQYQGGPGIVDKLRALGPVRHQVGSTDIQPSAADNAVILLVSGQVKIGADPASANALLFTQFFQLVNAGAGQYYVHNTVFRLIYA